MKPISGVKHRYPSYLMAQWTGTDVMKITLCWDLFYYLESIPNIQCRGIWCQVSEFGKYKLQLPDTRNLTPDT